MRLNRKRADELSFRREPLHALVAEFGGVDFVVLPDGDPDARAEFSLLFTAAAPLEHELRRREAVVGRCAQGARENRQARPSGPAKKPAPRQKALSARIPP